MWSTDTPSVSISGLLEQPVQESAKLRLQPVACYAVTGNTNSGCKDYHSPTASRASSSDPYAAITKTGHARYRGATNLHERPLPDPT